VQRIEYDRIHDWETDFGRVLAAVLNGDAVLRCSTATFDFVEDAAEALLEGSVESGRDCCVSARTNRTWVPRGLALTLSLLLLSATSGDITHALAGGMWHGLETTLAAAAGGPAEQNYPDPTSSHVATDCPLCRVGRASSAAPSAGVTCITAAGEGSRAVFPPQTPTPSSPHRRADAARAPPTRLSA